MKRRGQSKPFHHAVWISSPLVPRTPRCGLCGAGGYQHSPLILLLRAADVALSMGGFVHLKKYPGRLELRRGTRDVSLLCQGRVWSPGSCYPSWPLCQKTPLGATYILHRFPELQGFDFRCAFSEWIIVFVNFPFLSNRVPLVPLAKKERYVSDIAGSCPERFGSKCAYRIF